MPGMVASFARRASAWLRSASRSLAEDLHRDLRAHARQHVVDAVRDGLADLDGGRQVHQPLARMSALISSMLRVSSAVGQTHVEFAHVHAFGVLVSSARPLRARRASPPAPGLTSVSAWRASAEVSLSVTPGSAAGRSAACLR